MFKVDYQSLTLLGPGFFGVPGPGGGGGGLKAINEDKLGLS